MSHFFVFQDQDEAETPQEEECRVGEFSRRNLESNWDRYQESEKQEPDEDTPTQRGANYHVLLESAGELFPDSTPVSGSLSKEEAFEDVNKSIIPKMSNFFKRTTSNKPAGI